MARDSYHHGNLRQAILDAAGVSSKHPHYGRSHLSGGTAELPAGGREAVFADAGWSLDEAQCGTPEALVKGGWYQGRNETVSRNPGMRTRRATIRTVSRSTTRKIVLRTAKSGRKGRILATVLAWPQVMWLHAWNPVG